VKAKRIILAYAADHISTQGINRLVSELATMRVYASIIPVYPMAGESQLQIFDLDGLPPARIAKLQALAKQATE